MRVCARTCTCARARARVGARASECVYFAGPGPAQRVLLPPLFLPHHPLPSSPLPFSLAAPPPHSIQRRCRHHLRDTGRGVSRGQVRCEPAPNEAQRAPPVIFLKDLSTGGKPTRRAGYCGAEGSPRTAKGFLARGRQEGRALPPLENPSSLFCANSSTLGRGSLLEELADAASTSRTIRLRQAIANV